MAYLVICPTCGGKMSVNAQQCPHCGETDFFEPEMGWYSEPCRYEDFPRYALGCEGKGFLCRTQISGNYGITSLRMLNDMGVRDLSRYVRVDDKLYMNTDDRNVRETVIKAVAKHDLYIKDYGRWHVVLYQDKVRCPQCKGTGKVVVRKPTGNYIDIRKRV